VQQKRISATEKKKKFGQKKLKKKKERGKNGRTKFD
jgi:hypothetical protein